MKLDWRPVIAHWWLVLMLTLAAGGGQVRAHRGLAKLFGGTAGRALRTGLYLAQAGEFGFVLLTLGAEQPGRSPALAKPGAGQHGVLDARHAADHPAQQPHRDEAVARTG